MGGKTQLTQKPQIADTIAILETTKAKLLNKRSQRASIGDSLCIQAAHTRQ